MPGGEERAHDDARPQPPDPLGGLAEVFFLRGSHGALGHLQALDVKPAVLMGHQHQVLELVGVDEEVQLRQQRLLVPIGREVAGQARRTSGDRHAVIPRQPQVAAEELVKVIPIPPVTAVDRGGSDPLLVKGNRRLIHVGRQDQVYGRRLRVAGRTFARVQARWYALGMPVRPKKKAVRKAKPQSQGSALADFCRSLPGTTEDIKWGDDLVFSVGERMYAAFDIEDSDELGFKCSEEDFDRLTELDGIIPAPYAARFFWVKVQHRGALPVGELKRLIRCSFALVLGKLPKRVRRQIEGRP